VPTASEVLCAFAAQLRFADLPDAVIAKAKVHLLDTIGVALASSSLPFAGVTLEGVTRLSGAGSCTVFGSPAALPAPWAAMVNGVLAHGIDLDDTHLTSVVHVSCGVVPASVAVAQARGASGEELLTGLVLGLETAVRVGLVAPGAFHERGFHPTGVCGAFACAIAAGTLQRLNAAGLVDALGLAGSMAAGSLEFLSDGSWAKRLHAGWAAHGGIVAAELAGAGFRGPRGVFDGRFGLYRNHLGERGWQLEALTRDLGRRWELLDIALKPYPCCHFNHAFIDCAAHLQRGAAFKADDVARIECFVPPPAMPIVCEPPEAKRVPQTDYDAKFSLPYALASQLLRGHVDVDDFTDAAIREPAALELAALVECAAEPTADFPRRFPGRLRITLRDGRILEHHEAVNRGSAERPLDPAAVRDKFLRNACRVLAADQAERLMETVGEIERLTHVGQITRLCTPAAQRRTVA
jgi:2-methylcitrate dehydratase PrpD